MNQISQHGNTTIHVSSICIRICIYMYAYLIYELTISLLVALVTRPLTPQLTCLSGGSVRANVGIEDARFSWHFCLRSTVHVGRR